MTEIDDTMYRHTVAQRNAAWREVEYWQRQVEGLRANIDALTKHLANNVSMLANPPIKPVMLAEKESYEAGRLLGARDECEEIAKLFDNEVWSYDYREIAARIRARSKA